MSMRQSHEQPKSPWADYEPYPLSEREAAEQKRLTGNPELSIPGLDRRMKLPTRQTLGRVGLLLIAPAFIVHHVETNIQEENYRLSQTHPEIHHIYDAEAGLDSHAMVLVSTGLGTQDASSTARAEERLRQFGDVEAVEFDEKGLDYEVLADKVEERADERGNWEIILDGHSMGGRVALNVAAILHKRQSLRVKAVILDCTPFDMDFVRPYPQQQARALLRLLDNPVGAHYKNSPDMRVGIETLARISRFTDGNGIAWTKLPHVAWEVYQEKIIRSSASNALFQSQLTAIMIPDAGRSLHELADDSDGRVPPKIIYLSPLDNDADMTVDNAQSRGRFLEVGAALGLSVVGFTIDGSGHSDPQQHPDQYGKIYDQHVAPALRADHMSWRDTDTITVTLNATSHLGNPN